jgi:Rrf2 family transcriptional regulator, iron-sulfur cluster assembly transcription factor
MVKLGTRGRYAVLALCDLARQEGNSPLPLARLADRIGISASYLEQLFAGLRRAGLVHSVRGPGGGYRLSNQPADIKVSDVVRSVESGSEGADALEGAITEIDDPTVALWEEIARQVFAYLERVSLQDLLSGKLSLDELAA